MAIIIMNTEGSNFLFQDPNEPPAGGEVSLGTDISPLTSCLGLDPFPMSLDPMQQATTMVTGPGTQRRTAYITHRVDITPMTVWTPQQ